MPELTPEMIAMLERQRAYFSSDERIRELAAAWLDATPEECLVAVEQSCEEAAFLLSRLAPDELERALAPDPLPSSTTDLLERLWRMRAR